MYLHAEIFSWSHVLGPNVQTTLVMFPDTGNGFNFIGEYEEVVDRTRFDCKTKLLI